MRFYTTKITAPDANAYMIAHHAALLAKYPATDTNSFAALPGPVDVPLVPQDALPAANAAQDDQLNELRQCAESEITEAAPLVPGEVVEETSFTLLAEAFGDHPKGTGVLVRRTNMSETCFLFPDVQVLPSGLRVMPRPINVTGEVPEAPLMVAEAIASKAATMLLQKLGAAILAELFPDNAVPPYFDQVYAELRKIVKDELTKVEIEKKHGEFKAAILWMNTHYAKYKGDKPSPQLLSELAGWSSDMYKSVGIMREPRFAKTGFSTFLLGATTHLCMLQELANEGYGQDSLGDAPLNVAQTYAAHIDTIYPKLKKARGKKVVKGEKEKCETGGRPIQTVCWYYYIWTDKVTGGSKYFEIGKPKEDAEKERNKSRTQHVKKVQKALRDRLDNPPAISKSWKKLDV
ncbi:hypothetical protein [Roseovarius sp. 2305UL8-3]|uniref:hypothetical protein n=1 Tax=Roseovarius conchicola TaxID=3121636 RepID=UPI0035292CDF